MPGMPLRRKIKNVAHTAGKRVRRKAEHRDAAELVIITGMSGSGKASALKAFEDLGYYCVDNLPVELIPRFAELALQSGEIPRTALVVDVREGVATGEAARDFEVGEADDPDAGDLSGSERRGVAAALQRDAASASAGDRHDGAGIADGGAAPSAADSHALPTW